MAKIIRTDGTETPISPKNGIDFSLEELQKIVGGPIEILHTPCSGEIIVINEEGKCEGLPVNWDATAMFGWPLVGSVLVCDAKEVK